MTARCWRVCTFHLQARCAFERIGLRGGAQRRVLQAAAADVASGFAFWNRVLVLIPEHTYIYAPTSVTDVMTQLKLHLWQRLPVTKSLKYKNLLLPQSSFNFVKPPRKSW